MTTLEALAPTLVGIGLLVVVAAAALAAFGVPHRGAAALAVLRGAVQLAVISVILSGVISSPVFVAVALLVMFSVAAMTAARRIGWSWTRLAVVSGAMAGGVATTLAIVFLTGAIELTPRYALAIGGIIIGNAMTSATLAGRRFAEAVSARWDEVEGWLALGATPRQSTRELARGSVYSAMIPSIDQTKTTGLVTLPGAFVGAIFGGVSPLEAGRFQIVVLAGIMAAGAVTAVTLIAALGPVRVRPEPPG